MLGLIKKTAGVKICVLLLLLTAIIVGSAAAWLYLEADIPKKPPAGARQVKLNQNGVYFITFFVKDRQEMLGKIVGRDAPGAPGASRPANVI